MTAPASAEFRGLCRAQLILLEQGFGSRFGAVYLAEGWSEGRATRWLPLVVYPDLGAEGRALEPAARDPLGDRGEGSGDLSLDPSLDRQNPSSVSDLTRLPRWPNSSKTQTPRLQKPRDQAARNRVQVESSAPPNHGANPGANPGANHEIVVPLQQDGQVLGVLISRRDRPWSSLDYAQLEQIAQSLSMGCLLDRRLNWVQERYQRQELLQEQRQDILDNWIHQLRNPLMALRTFGKLLLRRLHPQDPNRGTVESMIREGDRIETLLAQMSRTIDGWMDELPEPDPVSQPAALGSTPLGSIANAPLLLPPASPLGDRLDLRACSVLLLLRPLLESFTLLAQDNDQTLELIVQDSAPVIAEANALREVLGNVIENALKYSGPGRHVWVELAIEGDRQHLRIIDNGPGIPAADLGRIFERHYRGIQADGAKPGSGLGLAIAREFVEQMGGELRVMSPVDWTGTAYLSREPGPGTCFEIQLPLAVADR
jgi:signal transduction histidine kinase